MNLDEFQPGTPCCFVEEETVYDAFVMAVLDRTSRLVMVNGKDRKMRISELLPYLQPWSFDFGPYPSVPFPVAPNTGNSVEEYSMNLVPLPACTYTTMPASSYSVIPYSLYYNYWESLYFQYGQYAVANSYSPPFSGSSTGNHTNGLPNGSVPTIQPQAYSAYDYTYSSYYYGFQSPPVRPSSYACGTAACNSNTSGNGHLAILSSSDRTAVEPASGPS
ncbi:hypothetical protein Y032_0570g94 [Ancylostoma ceylanicum]|uniref:Uncharacterized protein n=1 Tax=Ancylostoma ceylanicum TaxID=53326 RepID=A0A016WP20_9BILA|nr:hypothetical protein Y032_0570g94 [Ancylostoma ceylanicum]